MLLDSLICAGLQKSQGAKIVASYSQSKEIKLEYRWLEAR